MLLTDAAPGTNSGSAASVPFSGVRRLTRVRTILEESIIDSPPIKQLSFMVGLNRRKLTEGFKKVFDKTVANHALELRMRHGHQLLAEKQLSVAEIATECGYEHPGRFTLAFRRRFGCSPSQVRKTS